MCKPQKNDTLGDAERIPYGALKDFPTVSGHRVSRHDPGRWGDDGYQDPAWPPDAEFGRNTRRRRKDTRRWCHGKPGREHVLEVGFREFYGHMCGWAARYRRRVPADPVWICYHRRVCTACGKVLTDGLAAEDCPAWQAQAATGEWWATAT